VPPASGARFGVTDAIRGAVGELVREDGAATIAGAVGAIGAAGAVVTAAVLVGVAPAERDERAVVGWPQPASAATAREAGRREFRILTESVAP
jgi:hypothetical protein